MILSILSHLQSFSYLVLMRLRWIRKIVSIALKPSQLTMKGVVLIRERVRMALHLRPEQSGTVMSPSLGAALIPASFKLIVCLPCDILTPLAAMNARGGRSNVMVRFLASVAAACVWNACTLPIAAVVTSKTLSKQIYALVEQCCY